jgi:SAM-dependent methyltransferase
MTTQIGPPHADLALKERHRAMWALGDYPTLASEVIPDLGARLVQAVGVRPGDRVLDVAAGSGNVAIPAALTGADVVASDLTPELLEAGRTFAARRGAELRWDQGDAEALPYADDEFEVVLSCLGVMFAPHHQTASDELLRVVRPGGRIGLLSWTPEGFIGQMFATMRPYLPPPPPGVQPPPLWGSEEHVRGLLGDRVTDVQVSRETVRVERFADPDAFRDYFKANYGPTVAAYRGLAGEPDRAASLDEDLSDLARRHDRGEGLGKQRGVMEWEYLLVTARRR